MKRKDALWVMQMCRDRDARSEAEREAFDTAIEALKRERTDEWCTDCKEYDTEKKCCPRFNKVIREAMKRVPHEDGTLKIKVEDATKIGRVLISDDKHRGGLYYPDEDEPKGEDLISRAEAINMFCTLGTGLEQQDKTMITMVDAKYLFIKIIENFPSADRPRGEWIEPISYDGLQADYYICSKCRCMRGQASNFCPNCGSDNRKRREDE